MVKDKLNKGMFKFFMKKFLSINWVNHNLKVLRFGGNQCHTKKNPDENQLQNNLTQTEKI